MVKDLPHPYVFTLLPRKAKDRPHPRYEENGNSDDGNTWFPGSPPLSYFPIPIADPKRPWGSGACEQCGDKCAGHYLCPEEHHDFYQTHGRQGMKIKPPSVVISEALKKAERKGCNLSGEEKLALAKETLLTLLTKMLKCGNSTFPTCPPEKKKAAATRRHKNKGDTEGSTKEK